MSDRYDHDDDDYQSRSSYGSGGARSHGVNPAATGGLKDAVAASTADFANENSTRFFGLKLSPNAATAALMIYNQLLAHMSDKIDKNAAKAVYELAARQMGHARAKDLAHSLGPKIGWAAVFAEPALSVAGTFASAVSQLNESRRTLAPLVQASGSGSKVPQFDVLFSSGNPMVDAMRAKVLGQTKDRLIDALVRGVSIWPTVMVRMNNRHAQMKQFDEEILRKELKDAQDNPEEFARKISQQFNDKWKIAAAQRENLQAIEKEITEKTMKEFEAFKSSREGKDAEKQFKARVQEALTAINENEGKGNAGDYYRNTTTFDRHIRDSGIFQRPKKEDGKASWSLDNRGKAFKKVLEQHLKESFAFKTGQPLDDSWIPQEVRNARSGERPKTKLQTAREEFDRTVKSIDEDNRKKLEGHDEKHGVSDLTKQMFAGIGTLTSELAVGILGKKKDYNQPCATELLIHFENTLADAKSQDADGALPNRIPGIEVKGKAAPDMSYAEIVHNIFQENQRFLHHPIDERHFDHLKNIMGDDEKVQAAPDDELNAYEFAVKHISKRIKDERLSPGAMYVLATDKRRRIVQPDGKRFGPDGSYTDEKRAKAAVTKLLDELGVKFKPQVKASDDQVSEAEADFCFDASALRQAFGPQGLQGEQRLMLFLLVDHHLQNRQRFCEMSGVDAKECEAMEKRVQALLVPMVDAMTAEIAGMMRRKDEALKALEITDDEQKLVADLDHAIEKGEHAQDASREQRRTLEALLASAIVKFKEGHFWQDVVKRTQKKPKAEARKDDAEDEIEAGESNAPEHSDTFAGKFKKSRGDGMDDDAPSAPQQGFDADLDDDDDDRKSHVKHTERVKPRHGKHKESGVDYSMPL